MNIYTIHDSVAEYFMPIFLAHTHNEAKRMFIQSMGDKFVHRSDYTLFYLGTFEPDNGTIEVSATTSILSGASIPASMDPNPTHYPVTGIGNTEASSTQETQS